MKFLGNPQKVFLGEKKWVVFCHTKGGFGGGLTFVTKKVVLFFEGFPYHFSLFGKLVCV